MLTRDDKTFKTRAGGDGVAHLPPLAITEKGQSEEEPEKWESKQVIAVTKVGKKEKNTTLE